MNGVTMTNEEILRSFNNAAKPSEQVRILAELNACGEETIREILVEQGVDPRKLPRRRKAAAEQKAEKPARVPSVLQVIDREMAALRARWEEIDGVIPQLEAERAGIGVKLEALKAARAALAEAYETEGGT